MFLSITTDRSTETWLVVVLLLIATCSTSRAAWSSKPLTMLTTRNTTKPGCPRKCGNLTVPYPFGVGLGAGCSRRRYYDIFCADSFDPPKAFLPMAQDRSSLDPTFLEVLEITETHIHLSTQVAFRCYNSTSSTTDISLSSINFALYYKDAPYIVSGAMNRLIMVGCNSEASFRGTTDDYHTFNLLSERGRSTCRTTCISEGRNVVAGDCNGDGCCQASIPNGTRSFEVDIATPELDAVPYNQCLYALIGDPRKFKFRGKLDLNDADFIARTVAEVPMVLEWVIRNSKDDPYAYACQENTTYIDVRYSSGVDGYRCSCLPGYQGNPYLSPGCSGSGTKQHLSTSLPISILHLSIIRTNTVFFKFT